MRPSTVPTAILPPRPVTLVPLRAPQPYPPSDDVATWRPTAPLSEVPPCRD